ncbi:hypothetical protein [Pseudomonas phenolilytica]|uniref:hypothetical protein n=1 Tax=Pseudomonas phenolilytica TaxID=2746321 RepID=UPI001F37C837|nr:hypothetical protein [Pseudomonas phenolilytica]UIP87246.1 hypothetical protein HU825_12050 [Pseudomonas phenolilytica]
MGNIIDMASFEHLRRSNTDDRYTCPKTNVTFPYIYKVLVPEGELVDEVPVFVGTYSTEYRLKEPSNLEQLPDFPPLIVTKISTLDADAEIYLDVIHFTNKERAIGFRQACAHLGIEPESVRGCENDQGVFILLRRDKPSRKQGHIIYRSSKLQHFDQLGAEIECDYVAAFNDRGVIVPLADIEDIVE